MTSGPLNETELEWLDDILLNYGNDTAVMDISELDGMLTALLSAPGDVPQSVWLNALWGDEQPTWASEEEANRFTALVVQHWHDIAERLSQAPDQFEPLFGYREMDGQEYIVVEDWCFGYLRGVQLSEWPALPEEIKADFAAIALHGNEENIPQIEQMTPDAYEQSQEAIRPAALALYHYWAAQRH